MAKKQRTDTSRRARAAAIQAAEQRRARRVNLSIAAALAVVVVIVGLVVAKGVSGSRSGQSGGGYHPASAVVVQAVTGVPASVFDKVGAGTTTSQPAAIAKSRPLTVGGKPKVLYIGGEFCPFCAAERWSLAVALARFGTFSNLGQVRSAGPPETYPDTATLSFHKTSYTSKYLVLHAYETEDRQRRPLDQLSIKDGLVYSKFDAPPYVSQKNQIPFVDIGGHYLITTPAYDPAVLQGLSHVQIARDLSDPGNPVTKDIIGGANEVTAAICSSTREPAREDLPVQGRHGRPGRDGQRALTPSLNLRSFIVEPAPFCDAVETIASSKVNPCKFNGERAQVQVAQVQKTFSTTCRARLATRR